MKLRFENITNKVKVENIDQDNKIYTINFNIKVTHDPFSINSQFAKSIFFIFFLLFFTKLNSLFFDSNV